MVAVFGVLLLATCGSSETTPSITASTTAPAGSTVQSAQNARTISVGELPSDLAPLYEDLVLPDDRITVVETRKGAVYVTPRREAFGRCEATDLLPDRTTYKNIACQL